MTSWIIKYMQVRQGELIANSQVTDTGCLRAAKRNRGESPGGSGTSDDSECLTRRLERE